MVIEKGYYYLVYGGLVLITFLLDNMIESPMKTRVSPFLITFSPPWAARANAARKSGRTCLAFIVRCFFRKTVRDDQSTRNATRGRLAPPVTSVAGPAERNDAEAWSYSAFTQSAEETASRRRNSSKSPMKCPCQQSLS